MKKFVGIFALLGLIGTGAAAHADGKFVGCPNLRFIYGEGYDQANERAADVLRAQRLYYLRVFGDHFLRNITPAQRKHIREYMVSKRTGALSQKVLAELEAGALKKTRAYLDKKGFARDFGNVFRDPLRSGEAAIRVYAEGSVIVADVAVLGFDEQWHSVQLVLEGDQEDREELWEKVAKLAGYPEGSRDEYIDRHLPEVCKRSEAASDEATVNDGGRKVYFYEEYHRPFIHKLKFPKREVK